MKESPILFSAPMVRALLAGTKTQTRRIVKARDLEWMDVHQGLREPDNAERCPYGQPGGRGFLWVRETWAEVPRHEPRTDEDLPWREDGRILVYAADLQWSGARQFLCADGVLRWAKPERWRPSIHMPRWASRITLEVTGVRVERLQDIDLADALAEGISDTGALILDSAGNEQGGPIAEYAVLWEQINGPGSWAANPWVWVISFKKVTAP